MQHNQMQDGIDSRTRQQGIAVLCPSRNQLQKGCSSEGKGVGGLGGKGGTNFISCETASEHALQYQSTLVLAT